MTSSIFIKNRSNDPTDLFPPRHGSLHTTNKDLKFPNIRNKTIKDLSPVDFATYLMFEADNKNENHEQLAFQTSQFATSLLQNNRGFYEFVQRFNQSHLHSTPPKSITSSPNFIYDSRNDPTLSTKSSSTVTELCSWTTAVTKSEKMLTGRLKNNLSRGDRTRRIATGSDDYSTSFASDPLTDLIDSQNGLPTRALGGGALWSSDDGPDIPMTTALQMAEILLNEPLFSDKDIIDPTIVLKQTLEIEGYDPLLLGSLDALSVNKHKHYVEDVRKKLHISMREVRKNLLLHEYKIKIDDYIASKTAMKYDTDNLPVESKVSEVLKTVFRPIVAEVDHAVLPNLAEAYKFIFSEASSSLDLTELDSLLSRPIYSSSTHSIPSSYSSPYLSRQNMPSAGNMPVL